MEGQMKKKNIMNETEGDGECIHVQKGAENMV